MMGEIWGGTRGTLFKKVVKGLSMIYYIREWEKFKKVPRGESKPLMVWRSVTEDRNGQTVSS